jgi:hypothetical protein
MLSVGLAFALAAATPSPPAASPPAPGEGPLILFLIDNSASLPPLDPAEKRVVALERMFGFLKGQRYRLVLFGGKREVFVDDVARYRNDGQWTDFYHAFVKARELAAGYPPKTDLRMVLLTDAIADPDPADWPELPAGWDARTHSMRQTVELVTQMRIPLYVVLVGKGAEASADGKEQSPGFVLDLVRAANGAAAAPLAQSLASFFADDGVLLRRFVYKVAPEEGLAKIEPVIRRIAAPPRAGIELRIFTYLVLPLAVLLFVLLGLLVRSFPGPGDLEILELSSKQPVHVAVDKLRRLASGGWSQQGLSLVGDARSAAASFALQGPQLDLSGGGLDLSDLDPRDAALLPLELDELRRALEAATDGGTREEKIHALNLDYAARSLAPQEVERLLTRPPSDRGGVLAVDFVRAKTRLALDEGLRRKLLEPRVQLLAHGREGSRRALAKGDSLRIGRYGFLVQDITRGGRKDMKLVLYYDRVPSLFGLKTILPDFFQRAFRLRRSSQRTVS